MTAQTAYAIRISVDEQQGNVCLDLTDDRGNALATIRLEPAYAAQLLSSGALHVTAWNMVRMERAAARAAEQEQQGQQAQPPDPHGLRGAEPAGRA